MMQLRVKNGIRTVPFVSVLWVFMAALLAACTKIEAGGTLAASDCYKVVSSNGQITSSGGSVSASGLTVSVTGPNDAQNKPCPKIVSMTISAYRDINGNGSKDPGEPGSTLTSGGPDGPPSNSVSIGSFNASVGSGVSGAVNVTIDIGFEGGSTATAYNTTVY